MTTAIFWRFLWKEYRVMRAFWISMACLAVVAQLAFAKFPGLTHDPAAWTFSLALIFPALYAVACGATMFAVEKEEGTYEFLRSLPVTAWRILTGKLAFAIVSTLLLLAALWFVSARVSRPFSINAELRWQLLEDFGLAAIEGLAWGMLFSLILRRPLQAAVLAIAAGSAAVHVVLWRTYPYAGEGHVFDLGRYVAAVPYRAAIAAGVLFADGLLVRGWLQAEKSTTRRFFQRRPRPSSSAMSTAEALLLPLNRSVVLWRLIWQTWRQSRWTMAAVAGPGTLAALFAIAAISALSPWPLLRGDVPLYAAIAVAPSLMGACVFLADNERRSVRFLADHAVGPRQIWFARELTWLAGLAAWAIIWCGIIAFETKGRSMGHSRMVIALAIAGFACGQFASMLVPSGIVAGFVGVLLAIVCSAWASLMQVLEVEWIWSLAPIPLVLMFATWLRAPDWLFERNSWRGWLRVGLALAVPISALLIAVPLHRINQIPEMSPGFSSDDFARLMTPTAEEKKTAEMFVRAGESVVWPKEGSSHEFGSRPPNAWELEVLRLNSEPLAMALEASQRPECSFYGTGNEYKSLPSSLVLLLGISARELESKGKLDEAWTRHFAALRLERCLQRSPWTYDQLPLWAAQPGQTRERIVGAIKQLEQFETTLPAPTDELEEEYLKLRTLVTGGPDALAGQIHNDDPSHLILWSMLPWERRRAARLLNVFTAEDLAELEYVVSGIVEGRPVARLLRFSRWPPKDKYKEWLRTTVLLSSFYDQRYDGEQLGRSFARDTAGRRATHIVMALEAWKVDHGGKLPERLNQLVETYLDKLPLDPYTSRDFVYERNGISLPDNFSQNWARQWSKSFIWSAGENVRPVYPASDEVKIRDWIPDPFDEIEIKEQNGWRKAKDEFDIWFAGRSFEIP
jgi:hypothetical protein